MPYNFTHALVGLTALKQSNEAVATLISAHMGEFLVGTMGPDPYFGDSMPRPLFAACRVDMAEKLHVLDARTLFSTMLPLAGSNDALRAYVLGFLCHFLLDTTAHPYIEARFFGSAHTPAEIQMDLMMTSRVQSPGVPARPHVFYHTDQLRALDGLHAALANALFSDHTPGIFARGFRKWILINAITYDPNNYKRKFFGRIERWFHAEGKITNFLVSRHPDPDDRLNLSHATWRAPWDEANARNESFVDLFDHACAEAPAILNAALAAIERGDYADVLERIGARRMDARPV